MARRIGVIGLGNFGYQLAVELAEKQVEVLALDANPDRIDDIKDRVTHAVRLDATEEKALRDQGIQDVDAVIVAIGDNFEATLLAVASLQNAGATRIIVRATSEVHERILRHLGLKEIILPAVEAATRLANSLLFEKVVDSLSLSDDYTIAEVSAPAGFVEKTVRDLDLEHRYDVTLVTIKRIEIGEGFLGIGRREREIIVGVPKPDMTISRGDRLLIFGRKKSIELMTREP
jgi:trk system potassium uptake protein TrkA